MRQQSLRIFLSVFLIGVSFLSPIFGYDRHNIFLGASVGADFLLQDRKLSQGSFEWGLYGGYEYKPLKIIGIMAYLESLMAFKPLGIQTQIINQIGLNADVSLEIITSEHFRTGPYMGIGIGYINQQSAVFDTESISQVALLINGGWQMSIDESNIVRLGVKSSLGFGERANRFLHFMLSYAYRF